MTLLAVRGLRTHIPTRRGVLRAVDGIDLSIDAGEIVGLVGESGCGKTMAAYSILGLVPRPARIADGQILFQGEDLRGKSPEQLRQLRGSAMSMVFQEPLTALNPLFPRGHADPRCAAPGISGSHRVLRAHASTSCSPMLAFPTPAMWPGPTRSSSAAACGSVC